jgi:hypothetical protein
MMVHFHEIDKPASIFLLILNKLRNVDRILLSKCKVEIYQNLNYTSHWANNQFLIQYNTMKNQFLHLKVQ